MNRRCSSDSLDQGDRIICSSSGSSSPTDFTSDDESGANDVCIMTGLPIKRELNTSRSTRIGQMTGKVDDLLDSHRQRWNSSKNNPNTNRHIFQSTTRPPMVLGQHQPPKSTVDSLLRPSTSRYADSSIWSSSERYEQTGTDPQDENNLLNPNDVLDPALQSHEDIHWVNRPTRQRNQHSVVEGDINHHYGSSLADNEGAIDLYSRIDNHIGAGPHSMIESSRGMNNVTNYMCARLVECRSLLEAIDFIDTNRDIIDNLTRIVTTEAPAYRNYDMSNYQIDHSIRESFNPNFWCDREPIVTTADGNCQYHAVSISLTGSEAYTSEVRLATAVAVIENREWFNSILRLIDKGTVLDLVHTIARSFSWGDETTLKAIAVAINRRIFLYTCNIGKKDYEMVKSLNKDELLDAFKEKKYRGGTGIHTYADPLVHVSPNNYIMLFHKSEHFIAVLPTSEQPTMFEPYNPIVPVFS